MYGQQAYLPIDVDFQTESLEELSSNYFKLKEPDMAQSEYKLVLEEAEQNILKAQVRQKKNYDKKHSKPGVFIINSLVLKLNHRRKKTKGGKLNDRFVGPYKILSCLPHGVYKLQDNKGVTIRATGSHLKIYKPSDPTLQNCKTYLVDYSSSDKESFDNQCFNDEVISPDSSVFIESSDSISENEPNNDNYEDLNETPQKSSISGNGSPSVDALNYAHKCSKENINCSTIGDTYSEVKIEDDIYQMNLVFSCKNRCATKQCPCK